MHYFIIFLHRTNIDIFNNFFKYLNNYQKQEYVFIIYNFEKNLEEIKNEVDIINSNVDYLIEQESETQMNETKENEIKEYNLMKKKLNDIIDKHTNFIINFRELPIMFVIYEYLIDLKYLNFPLNIYDHNKFRGVSNNDKQIIKIISYFIIEKLPYVEKIDNIEGMNDIEKFKQIIKKDTYNDKLFKNVEKIADQLLIFHSVTKDFTIESLLDLHFNKSKIKNYTKKQNGGAYNASFTQKLNEIYPIHPNNENNMPLEISYDAQYKMLLEYKHDFMKHSSENPMLKNILNERTIFNNNYIIPEHDEDTFVNHILNLKNNSDKIKVQLKLNNINDSIIKKYNHSSILYSEDISLTQLSKNTIGLNNGMSVMTIPSILDPHTDNSKDTEHGSSDVYQINNHDLIYNKLNDKSKIYDNEQIFNLNGKNKISKLNTNTLAKIFEFNDRDKDETFYIDKLFNKLFGTNSKFFEFENNYNRYILIDNNIYVVGSILNSQDEITEFLHP